MTHLDSGDLVFVKFMYQEQIPGTHGVYRLCWETEPAHVVEVSKTFVKIRFIWADWLMVVERKDLTSEPS